MNKVAVFNLREFDEAEWFEKYAGDLGLELSTCPDAPDMDNIASVTEGCECADNQGADGGVCQERHPLHHHKDHRL